jgi:kumamolisin
MRFSLRRRRAAPAAAGGILLPRDVAALYGVDQLHAAGFYGDGERIGFIEFAPPSDDDDAAFWARYSLAPERNRPARTVVVDRASADPGALDETDLDLQYAGALAPGAELIVYLIDDRGDAATFLGQVYDALQQAAADGVRIVSVSLGTSDALAAGAGCVTSRLTGQRWDTPEAFAAALDALVADMRVFCAAGDSGAYGGLPFGDPEPQPIWPAVQAGVVAVGGTQLAVPGDLGSGEQAWGGQSLDPRHPAYNPANTLPGASGGGGVSRFVPAPARQAGASHRATPDIAAFAGPLLIVDRGDEQPIWGTSASAPIVAAIAALVHQATGRLPDHAALAAGARDVTAGNNWNNALLEQGLPVYYGAGPGFDLCTGAGTPYVPAILRAMGA